MPIYEFVCRECSRGFEELVRGDARAACPSCGSGDVERVLSVVSVGRGSAGQAAVGPCGSCGDPRGPGACRN